MFITNKQEICINLPTLKYRHHQVDMIELFKIIKECMILHVFHISISLNYKTTSLGNRYKLTQHHCHYDSRKYTYTNRVIPIWNSLSDYVVSVETFNTVKSALINSGLIKMCCTIIMQISMASVTIVL